MSRRKNIQNGAKPSHQLREPVVFLMFIAILVIVGFQGYWLRENYKKEKEDLQFKANVLFRETVFQVQRSKFKLDGLFSDSTGSVRVEVSSRPSDDVMMMATEQVGKLIDSLGTKRRSGIVISQSNDMLIKRDTTMQYRFINRDHPRGEGVVQFLYGIDSLQEPVFVEEVDSAYRVALGKEGMNVDFKVVKTQSTIEGPRWIGPGPRPPEPGKVTVGFKNPTTFELELGDSYAYIFKQLTSPLLFSLFLIGVTILSFVMLFRNLMRQRRLAEIKNEFIGNITHELKTPIATVGVAIEALRNFNAINDPARTKEYLDISQNELHRLSLLVDKVLKLSMFEKKEIDLKYEELDLKEAFEEVVGSMRLQLEKHHAKVSVFTEGNLWLKGDRLHLISVVFNLLDNALKYTKGEPAIQVELKEVGDHVMMSIKDNGIGVPAEYQDKLFEKFFRVPAGDTHNAKGYGLGLSYVAHVVNKHKGTIKVDSQPGLGTKFTITLPKQHT